MTTGPDEPLPGAGLSGALAPGDDADAVRLVERARAGDGSAFAELIGQHGQAIVSLCYASTLNHAEAEELAQEVFLAAWRGLRRFRRDAGFRTWLYAIARNACVDASRRRRARPRMEPFARESIAGMHHSDGAREAAASALAEAGKLALPLRQALLMRDVQGLAYDEIARLQDVPIGTVRSRIAAARRAVAEGMER